MVLHSEFGYFLNLAEHAAYSTFKGHVPRVPDVTVPGDHVGGTEISFLHLAANRFLSRWVQFFGFEFLCEYFSYITSLHSITSRADVSVVSPEIAWASLHKSIPWYRHLYALPFLSLYPVLAYAYFVKYDTWLVSEEWTFLACVSLGAGHALSFLVTRWSTGAKAWVTAKKVNCLEILLSYRLIF